MPTGTLDERFFAEAESREKMREHDNFIKIGSGFIERGIPEAIFETRAGSWLADVDADNFLARIDFLLREGKRVHWDHAFPLGHDLFETEWNAIRAVRSELQGDEIDRLEGENVKLSANNERSSEIAWGVSLGLVASLVVNFFDGKQNQSGEVFPPAQVEKLTDNQIEILRQQMEHFLEQNQHVEGSVAE